MSALELLILQVEIVVNHLLTIAKVTIVGSLLIVLQFTCIGCAQRLTDIFADGIDKNRVTVSGEIDNDLVFARLVLLYLFHLLEGQLIFLLTFFLFHPFYCCGISLR